MDSWDRAQSLFLDAVDLPPAELARFLDTACAGDPELRAELESLLISDRKNGEGITAVVETEASLLFESPAPSERLGAYRIVREIGRGGMGAVYLATRDDDQYRKQVAIKVIKRGMDSADVLARFRYERQILANLDHPYIARLHDGGTTADGRPFFVMEYVEGQPLDAFCRERGLDAKARCRLFLLICEAVSHAHRNLVVHRDLKPANIFVTPAGLPKLLDFGIAKLLGGPGDGQTTIAQARRFTPDYASPEQVRGLSVTTAADVYSLGAILYELLTGERPHRISGSTALELERAICEAEVIRPAVVARGLDADLDNIVLMAMRKEPERRYASVDQFADDIRRYLEGHPVAARKDSLLYRTRKFAARRRYALTAGAAIVASLLCGIVIALSQARQAKSARDVAVSERRHAEERMAQILGLSNRSLSQVYALMAQLPGAMPARKELLSEMLDFLEKLSRDAGPDDRLNLPLAKAYLRLGDLQGDPDAPNIGDTPGALASYRRALGLLGPLPLAPDRERLAVWADLQNKLGKVYTETGERAKAREVLQSAIRTFEAMPPRVRENPSRIRAALYLSFSRATFDAPRSLALANEALKEATAVAKAAPQDNEFLLLFSTAYTQVGYVHLMMGDVEAAAAPYLESIRLREQVARTNPNDPLYRLYLKLAYEHYASLQHNPERVNLGHPEIATLYYKKAQPLEEADLADPQNLSAKYNYAAFLVTAAMVDVTQDKLAESLATLRKAAAILQALHATDPGVERYENELAVTFKCIGQRLLEMHRYADALAEYRRAWDMNRVILARDPADQTVAMEAMSAERGMTKALMFTGDRSGAIEHAQELIQRASTIRVELWREAAIGEDYLTLAMVHRQFGDCEKAKQAAERSIAHLRPLIHAGKHDLNDRIFGEANAIGAECSAPPSPLNF